MANRAKLSIASAVWSLWLARNENVFEDKVTPLKEFISKTRAYIWIKAVNAEIFLNEEDWWNNPSGCIKVKDLFPEWIPPKEGDVKFNVDGAFKDTAAGYGGILRTNAGDIIAMFSGPVDVVSSDYAELVAIKTALSIFVEAGWLGKANLVIEVVLNWIGDMIFDLGNGGICLTR